MNHRRKHSRLGQNIKTGSFIPVVIVDEDSLWRVVVVATTAAAPEQRMPLFCRWNGDGCDGSTPGIDTRELIATVLYFTVL